MTFKFEINIHKSTVEMKSNERKHHIISFLEYYNFIDHRLNIDL